jgi:hypothetical protein
MYVQELAPFLIVLNRALLSLPPPFGLMTVFPVTETIHESTHFNL